MLPDDPYDLDQWLVEQTLKGNQRAANRLFARHYEDIYRRLYLQWRFSQEDARDLSQEVFIKAWRCLPSLQQGHSFASWLRSIATRVACDALRSRKRHIQSSPIDPDFDIIDRDSTPEEQVIAIDRFESALKSMSEPRQKCLYRFYRDRQEPRAIAKDLNLNESTVRTYISQARRDLLAALSGQQTPSQV